MSDRGMKKWAPYSSLIEQATCLEEMKYQRNKIAKPILTEDQKEKINYVLQSYQKGQVVKIKFFNDGYLYYINSTIKRIDLENRRLILEHGNLDFVNIIDMEVDGSF
ncbi:MAG: YolD-like family protein [Bacilli bacterium]|nr:YolD-like family protein [Bacilli bacterium]